MAARVTDLQIFKAEFFRALAHPVRILILEQLRDEKRSVQELQAGLGLDQPSVSRQLAILRSRGLVTATKLGATVRYAVRDRRIHDLLHIAREIFNGRLTDAQAMLKELRREARRS
jgi:DNA-binding transcriptional ArsR family regulator